MLCPSGLRTGIVTPPTGPKSAGTSGSFERGGRCECRGECGRGTHHGPTSELSRCPNRHGQRDYTGRSTVVLTTAHLNHRPEDCAPENLRGMCQGCHLWYDRDHHAETRASRMQVSVVAELEQHDGGLFPHITPTGT